MKKLDERGKQCPMPVIETKKVLESAAPGEVIEVIVDNEIAVQNLMKMANHKQLKSQSEKRSDAEYAVRIEAGADASGGMAKEAEGAAVPMPEEEGSAVHVPEEAVCPADSREKGTVVVLSSAEMGSGDAVLGKLLMKGFVYALSHQEELPETVLLYNGGAFLSCEGSESLEDLKEMEAMGVEIHTCGTCLNYYGLEDKLRVGDVTNMYDITEILMKADKIIRP